MDTENLIIEGTEDDVHLGYNIKRIREIKGIKQDVICDFLGISQPYLSKLEKKAFIKDELLNSIAKAMGIEPQVIREFKEGAVQIHSNTFSPTETATAIAYQYNYHPLEKVVELYERLIKSEQEKNDLLNKLLSNSGNE